MIAADISDFRALAKRRLPNFLFEYVDGGSFSETTMRRNIEDLQAIRLRQRVMHDVSAIDLSTTLMGKPAALPIALAPIGLAGMYARRGEVQAARAAEAAGVPMILSTMACCSLEEVRAAASQPTWLQLYMIRDRGFMRDLLARTEAAGVDTLVLTVDLPVHSVRHRDVRSGLTGSQGVAARLSRMLDIARHPAWAWDVGVHGRPHILGNVASAMPAGAGLAQFTAWVGRNFDPSITWKDIDWLRQHWTARIVVKGVLDPADAVDAVAAGAQGLVVSNHGGRQLDGASSSIAALPAVVDAVAGQVPVLMDGGVRSGLDVLRALALGAQGVLIGRAWAFALAARGQAGVAQVLDQLRHEMEVAMALTGQTDVKTLDRSMLQ
ncbi:MAG: lldD [Caulobacter sp.]|nr:lldD [Caulobacter sp.]